MKDENKVDPIISITFNRNIFRSLKILFQIEDEECFYCDLPVDSNNIAGIFDKPKRLVCSETFCMYNARCDEKKKRW